MLDCRSAMAAICARTGRRCSRPPQDFVRAEPGRLQWVISSPSSHRAPWAAPWRGACTSAAPLSGPRWRGAAQRPPRAPPRRAAEAGMIAVESDRDLVEGVDIVLSIVPPGEAIGLGARLLPLLA